MGAYESDPRNKKICGDALASHVVFLGMPLPTMHAIARIGLVDYHGRFTANDPQWKPKEARKHHNSSQNVLPKPGSPNLQGPSTAPAGPILLKFWLKTWKSILNKVTKFQIPTPNRLAAAIEKPSWAESAPVRNRVNPRPAGVWLVTRPAGGAQRAPPEISQTTGPISKFQTPFDSPVRELPVQGQKFDPEVTDDVTGQVKVRIFDFSGLVTSASKISMLSANKANESAWIVSLTSVSIISCAL